MKLKLLFLLLLLSFSFSFVNAVPPQQISDTILEIETAYPSFHKINEDYYVHTHVYNTATEELVTSGITCYYHFYNHQINGGEHIVKGTLDSYGMGYEDTINGSLINETGEFSTLIWCNSSTEIGFNKFTFEVTPTGTKGDNLSVVYLILTTLVLLGIFLYLASQYMDNEKTFGVGLYFYLISFVLLVYVLFLQFNIMEKGLYWLGLTSIQLTLFSSITYSLIGITFIGFTYLLVKYLGNIKEYKSGVSYGDSYDPKSKSYQY